MTEIQQYLPDPLRPTIGDIQIRNLYFRSRYDVTVENVGDATTTFIATEPARIRSVEVAADSAGAGNYWAIQVQVDDRDSFDASVLAYGGLGPREPLYSYNFPAGAIIDVIIVTAVGAPVDLASVTIDLEPYILAPQSPQLELHGANRKRPSTREQVKEFNATGSLVPAIVTQRVVGKPTPKVLPIGEPLGYVPRGSR